MRRVLTVDRDFRVAGAVAVKAGRILAAGTSADVRTLAGRQTTVLDLGGRTVLPGINDAHLHLPWFGLARPPMTLDLSPQSVRSVAELRAAVAQRAAELPRGQWVRGQGWHEHGLRDLRQGDRGPSRTDLDDVSPEVLSRPVENHLA